MRPALELVPTFDPRRCRAAIRGRRRRLLFVRAPAGGCILRRVACNGRTDGGRVGGGRERRAEPMNRALIKVDDNSSNVM